MVNLQKHRFAFKQLIKQICRFLTFLLLYILLGQDLLGCQDSLSNEIVDKENVEEAANDLENNCQSLSDNWQNFAENFTSAHCQPCHPTYVNYNAVGQNAQKILSQVYSRHMPLIEQPSDEDRHRFVVWLICGLPYGP